MPEEKAKDQGKPCRVCGKRPEDTAMVFKNEPWCSDKHRKIIQKEVKPDWEMWRLGFHDRRLMNTLWEHWKMDAEG